ncbi:MAG TPA: hypothetical protein VGR11_08250 [Solirubrobacteraceae bacterium]|nr:hypothetical protein [Solirubrobacteraceae bacterium]
MTLPSGKTIEVISFDDNLAPAQRELHVCPECDSQLVYPVTWEEADAARWTVDLRCPDCEWTVSDTFDGQLIQRFDETLDRGTEALIDDLRKLARANMQEDVERFIAAVNAEFVLPEDF